MALIGNIAVGLTARTAKFQTGMRRASRTVKRFGKAALRVGKIVAKTFAIAFTAAAAAITLYTKKAFAAIDVTAKLSDELGISTERLKGFEFAAGLTGTKSETLRKGLQRMIRILGEAKLGFGEGASAIERLGLNAADLTSKSPADALLVISDRIKGLETAADRAASAYAIFGRQGQELMNFLLLGSDGMNKLQKEAVKLGVAFNRVDAAKVEEANDAILRMSTAFEGVFNTLAIRLAPILTEVITKFTKWANQGPGLAKNIDSVLDGMVNTVGALAQGLELVKVAWWSINAGVNRVGAAILTVTEKVMRMQAAIVGTLKYTNPLFYKPLKEYEKFLRSGAKVAAGSARGLSTLADEQERKAMTAGERFKTGAAGGAAEAFLRKLRIDADNRAAAAVGAGKGRAAPAAIKSPGASSRKSQSFQQVELDRLYLGGGASAAPDQRQEVSDPVVAAKLGELIRILAPGAFPQPVPSGVQ